MPALLYDFDNERGFDGLLRRNFKGGFQSRNCAFSLRAIRGVDTAKRRGFFHPLAGFGHSVNTHVVIDDRFFGEPAAAQVADDFTDDARVALRDKSGARRF